MNLLQPGLFPESTSAHCCYKYEGFSGNQLEVCSMPDGDAVKRKCGSKPISSQRKMHEKELGTQNHFILEFHDTFTTCPTIWSGGGGSHHLLLRIPILMGFNDKLKTFKKKGCNDGSHCPNEKNSLDLSTSNTVLTDCYGQDISTPVALDHCGNPSVSSPPLSSWATSRSPPQIQLISLNQLPDSPAEGQTMKDSFAAGNTL
ncbi:unnamed protein product [Orchesella dallaii]|uniref:Uncharacterized protein n=1 Tax=Orchesella dallaii TaxID=48710 RepID=A0ABP1R7G4_9HEXA